MFLGKHSHLRKIANWGYFWYVLTQLDSNNLPEKEHSGTFNNPRLFPETWWEIEYFEVKDGSRLCLLVTSRWVLGTTISHFSGEKVITGKIKRFTDALSWTYSCIQIWWCNQVSGKKIGIRRRTLPYLYISSPCVCLPLLDISVVNLLFSGGRTPNAFNLAVRTRCFQNIKALTFHHIILWGPN